MGAAFFYHLTQAPLVVTLASLSEKSLAAGWRVEVRGRSEQMLAVLDTALWAGDGILPHGLANGPHDADQPVLLTLAPGTNRASCIMSVGGAEISADEVARADRVCILFDGHDPEAVQQARVQWKSLTAAGAQAQYWSEESGRWEKKAESA